MRDEYVGDIGDFGKYILLTELRKIAGQEVKIGINWYYNTRPAPAFRYLFDSNLPKFNETTSKLLNRLDDIYKSRKPRLLEIENDGDILQGFIFYGKPIPFLGPAANRELMRKRWFDKSAEALKDADIVFLDPDNGIAPTTVTKARLDAVKYTFVEDIEGYYCDSKAKSVIIYQHENRMEDGSFLPWFTGEIQKIDPCKEPILIRCPRYMPRYYAFIAKTKIHHDIFTNLFTTLTANHSNLFEPVNLGNIRWDIKDRN